MLPVAVGELEELDGVVDGTVLIGRVVGQQKPQHCSSQTMNVPR